jgi:cytochrome c oxidase assembly protein subunit 15
MSKATSKTTFQKINLLSIVLLFVLILAGGVVRSTGSGMGCPDWPKCFGGYIPPTSAAELPADYKQKYINGRLTKNLRFAKTLDLFGYGDLAQRIRQDKSILVPEEFNAARTWTEYINRLIGAISGLFILAATIYSFSYWSINKSIPLLSVFNLILIGFQAWLGSLVVSTNLTAWVITVHLLLALAILAIAIGTYHLAKVNGKYEIKSSLLTRLVTLVVLILSTLQITFGTEVREKIDSIASRLQEGYRGDWVTDAGTIFFQHRDAAIVVLIGNIMLYALVRKGFGRHSLQQQLMSFTFLMLVLQIVTGILLTYVSLPPMAQAAHILLASLIFGAQFYLLLNLYRSVNRQEVRI